MDWAKGYNQDLGLWVQDAPGHTLSTKSLEKHHPGPNASTRLLAAAQVGELDRIDVHSVLKAIRDLVWEEDDGRKGCVRWSWEDDQPYDTNAAFFTGLSLIVIRKLYYDDLDPESQRILDDILDQLWIWFSHTMEHATIHYPNKYLGDLVCAWLLLEILGRSEAEERVRARMIESADYWLENGWGWGEHLSDIYTGVCLNELSVLLLLSDRLPGDLREKYTSLIEELLSIEDAFDGPRVPCLRSYAFTAPRPHTNYRDRVKPWEDGPKGFGNSPDLGNLLYGLGWHDRMPARKPREPNPVIGCFGGKTATARVEDDIRIGSVSRFPVMPSAEHPGWGLSWQCFPVVFERGESDRGFLQWEAEEDGVVRAHPGHGGPIGLIPKALSSATVAPVTGQTFALQREGNLLALRLMRVIPSTWETLTDRFRLVTQSVDPEITGGDTSSTLSLPYAERKVIVHSVPLTGDLAPVIVENEFDGTDWSLTYQQSELPRVAAHVWAISIEGWEQPPVARRIDDGPPMARVSEESVWEIDWLSWTVRIDPLSEEPLREV